MLILWNCTNELCDGSLQKHYQEDIIELPKVICPWCGEPMEVGNDFKPFDIDLEKMDLLLSDCENESCESCFQKFIINKPDDETIDKIKSLKCPICQSKTFFGVFTKEDFDRWDKLLENGERVKYE